VDLLAGFRRVKFLDFEFKEDDGETPIVHCCSIRDWRSGEVDNIWLGAGHVPPPADFTDPRTLYIAYNANAELKCHLATGWPLPTRVLDLYIEFRNLTNGLKPRDGNGLVGALMYFGLDAIDAAEKESWRKLAIRGGPFTDEEMTGLMEYCQGDVDALARLLPVMLPHIDLPSALIRGRYQAAVARMERNGVPIDLESLEQLRSRWAAIKYRLIREVDKDYGVYVRDGLRTLNPASNFGAAVLRAAKENGIDPYRLADAADQIWWQERDASKEVFAARKAARAATGLYPIAINRWEDAGHDHTTWPSLDVKARELARLHPALGIGLGYSTDYGEDTTDYGAELWEVLRDRDETHRPKHHPLIIDRALELLAAAPDTDSPVAMRFSEVRMEEYLIRAGIAWPTLPSGRLQLDQDTFSDMARIYPREIGPLRDLRHAVSQLKLNDLAVGKDGRNRTSMRVFASITGRNQPSNSKAIFGPACWLRSLIRPAEGMAIAYIDWSAQELAIAAILSGDVAMQEAYLSSDPYIWLARKVGAVPPDATKKTHPKERERFKVVSLGVLYGLSAFGAARKLCLPTSYGREIVKMHQQEFPQFWRWSEQVEMEAMLAGQLQTVFGWTAYVGSDPNPRTFRNFPMQSNGSEMLRLACCLATERGITVCVPVHDAIVIEAAEDEIEDVAERAQAAMREASEIVLDGFAVRTEAKIVRHPDRYEDERGVRMWETVQTLLAETGALVEAPSGELPW
jgi:hypothetical protein